MSGEGSERARSVTLGEWRDLVESRGWGDEAPWLLVRDCARAALGAVRSRLRPGEDEELVAEVVVLARHAPKGWLLTERRGVGLVRWLGGVMKHRLAAMRRDELDVNEASLDRREVRVEREAPAQGIDVSSVLTPKQLASWELHRQGFGSRAAAKLLGISRDAHRDRIERATKRVELGTPAPTPRGSEWIEESARHLASIGDDENAALLLLRGAGASYRACADVLRFSVAAVACRLARLWRVWNARPTAAGPDRPLPSATFRSRRRASSQERGGRGNGSGLGGRPDRGSRGCGEPAPTSGMLTRVVPCPSPFEGVPPPRLPQPARNDDLAQGRSRVSTTTGGADARG